MKKKFLSLKASNKLKVLIIIFIVWLIIGYGTAQKVKVKYNSSENVIGDEDYIDFDNDFIDSDDEPIEVY